MPVTPPIPARKPPRKPKYSLPTRRQLYSALFGLSVGLFFVVFEPEIERPIMGPKYLAAGVAWQSFDVEWIDLAGKVALNLSITGHKYNGPEQGTRVNNALLMSLCGSVLADLPSRTGKPVSRGDIYRLGFRFPIIESNELGDIVSVAVFDGVCEIVGEQGNVSWNYPGILKDWYATLYEVPAENGDTIIAIEFQHHRAGLMTLDQFDAVAACKAVLVDPPTQVERLLLNTKRIRIYANNGHSRGWEFLLIDGACVSKGAEQKT